MKFEIGIRAQGLVIDVVLLGIGLTTSDGHQRPYPFASMVGGHGSWWKPPQSSQERKLALDFQITSMTEFDQGRDVGRPLVHAGRGMLAVLLGRGDP